MIIALSSLLVGFWWNFQALWAWTYNLPTLKVYGDILPFQFSVGDLFLYIGYAIFAVFLGILAGNLISKLVRKCVHRV